MDQRPSRERVMPDRERGIKKEEQGAKGVRYEEWSNIQREFGEGWGG